MILCSRECDSFRTIYVYLVIIFHFNSIHTGISQIINQSKFYNNSAHKHTYLSRLIISYEWIWGENFVNQYDTHILIHISGADFFFPFNFFLTIWMKRTPYIFILWYEQIFVLFKCIYSHNHSPISTSWHINLIFIYSFSLICCWYFSADNEISCQTLIWFFFSLQPNQGM